MMPATGQCVKAGLTAMSGHFSHLHLFLTPLPHPHHAQGPWEGDAKEESHGNGNCQDERPLLPGIGLAFCFLS